MKNKLITTCFAIFTFQSILASCGLCKISKNEIIPPKGAFITSINEGGSVNGYLLASYSMCNFGKNNKKCSLVIQINEKAYNVKGSNIDDHGDSHANDGYCNVIKKIYVEGRVRGKSFTANKMEFPSI